jgi:hypothetical protein
MGLVGSLAACACLLFANAALADGITNASDDLRTGWYPDESSLTPQLVGGSTFGQLWSASVNGQVYAQPLYTPSSHPDGTLIVATENDYLYGLDPATGAQEWVEDLAPNGPWNPADIGCGDIQPSIGTTSTPVIDPSTGVVYLTYKTYDDSGKPAWYMDARDVNTGSEKPGWPVQLATPPGGYADNAQVTFFPKTQQQRPGLLLMNGVVYAAFGSHCDTPPWQGWIFGVSTAGASITARWVDEANTNGGGIWQSGVGLTSDGPGQILFATGNGGAPTLPATGSAVPSDCGECVMRVQVQSNGSLKAVDFFAPYDAAQLDQDDQDFASGGVVGLPDQYFGTSTFPHLAVAVGKEGYVYLLNRDDLGGYDQGSGGGDAVVERIGPRGGVWDRAGVWPGDGGYVYIPTSTGQNGGGLFDVYKYGVTGSGTPSLSLAASSSDVFGWGSGSPVITSDGTTSGSAIVWEVWSSDRQGDGGQLRAYSAVPAGGALHELFSASIGSASNYSSPGVGAGRIYVGARDGHVLAFGSPNAEPLNGSGVSFPPTTQGSSSAPQTLTMTAQQGVTVQSLNTSSSDFALGSPSQTLPATLNAGQTLSVPVTFTPGQSEQPGPIAGQLTAATNLGDVSFSLSGTAQATNGLLQSSPPGLSLGGTAVGQQLTGTVTFSNAGGTPLYVKDVKTPNPPFSATGLPPNGSELAPQASVTIDVSFESNSVGQYSDAITLDTTDGQSKTIPLSASASTPGLLQFSSENLDFGTVPVNGTATRTFTITNMGGTDVIIEKSKPPFGGEFAATSSLPEGTTIGPGKTVTETVTFTPTSPGTASGAWYVTGNDTSGPQTVTLTGTTPPTASTSSAPGTGSQPTGSSSPSSVAPRVVPRAPTLAPPVASTARVRAIYLAYTAVVRGVSHFVLEQARLGRRDGKRCDAVDARNRSHAYCIRFVPVKAFSHLDRADANRLRLTAYVPARKLTAGTYRVRATLLDSAGGKHTFDIALRIIIPSHRRPAVRAAWVASSSVTSAFGRVLARLLALVGIPLAAG